MTSIQSFKVRCPKCGVLLELHIDEAEIYQAWKNWFSGVMDAEKLEDELRKNGLTTYDGKEYTREFYIQYDTFECPRCFGLLAPYGSGYSPCGQLQKTCSVREIVLVRVLEDAKEEGK